MPIRELTHDWWPGPLPANVEIGDETWLHSAFAFVHCASERPRAVTIGNHCGVYINTQFDLGPDGEVVIGDYCTIVGLIVATNGRVEIGSYSFIAHDVLIADSFVALPPQSRDLLDRAPAPDVRSRDITLGENVWIGAKTVLLPGARIGDNAIIGAGTVVDFDVPPMTVVAGNPARVVGSVGRGRDDNERLGG